MTDAPVRTFRQICSDELARLEVFDDWRRMDGGGKREYRKWCEARTTDPAKIRRLVDETVTRDALPTLAGMTRLWLDLYPPTPVASSRCGFCGGSGFEIVEQGGYSGAKRCRCRNAA